MPYSKEYVEKLKSYSPDVQRGVMERMSGEERSELVAAIKQYSQPQPEPKPQQNWAQKIMSSAPIQGATDLAAETLRMAVNKPFLPFGAGGELLNRAVSKIPAVKAVQERVNTELAARERAYEENPMNQGMMAQINRLAGGVVAPMALQAGVQKIGSTMGQAIRRMVAKPEEVAKARMAVESARKATGAELTLGEALEKKPLQLFEKSTETAPYSGRVEQIKKAGEAINKKVADIVKTAKVPEGETGKVMTAAAKQKLEDLKHEFGKGFNAVREIAGDTPATKVNAMKAYDDAIARFKGINRDAVEQIEKAKAAYADPDIGRTFAQQEQIQDASQYFGAMKPDDPLKRILAAEERKISRAIGKDMHATLNKVDPTGETSKAYSAFNEAYNRQVRPLDPNQSGKFGSYRSEARAIAGKPGFEQDAINKVLETKSVNKLDYFKKALPVEGHEAVASEALYRIAADAHKNLAQGVPISPLKLVSSIEKYKPVIERFGSQEQMQALEGLKKYAKMMPRVGQFMEQPPTGMHEFMFKPVAKMLSALTQGALKEAAGEGAAFTLGRTYNQYARDFMLKASKAKTETEMSNLVKEYAPYLFEQAGATAYPKPSEEKGKK